MPQFLVDTTAVLMVNIIPTLIVLTAVVFVHEMGHFLAARWCGIRVAAFSVGFGRELAGFTDHRGTRWKLSAIPLGGYVRFEGDENAASIPDAEALARVPPSERVGLFHFAPVWKRVAVVAAGPIANFILAILVFAAVFATIGRPHSDSRVETVLPFSAAEQAGFLPGDIILSVDGDQIDSFAELQNLIALSAEETLAIDVRRNGAVVTLTATPERREQPDRLGGTQRIGVLGIASGRGELVRDDPLTAVVQGTWQTGEIVKSTLKYLSRLLTGRESAEQLSGPIRIGQISGVVLSESGIPGFVYLGAFLSVSIGLFNLFPIPMLDGGHLVFYAIEAVQRRPLSSRAQDIGFRIGFALLIMLFIFVNFNDITRIVAGLGDS